MGEEASKSTVYDDSWRGARCGRRIGNCQSERESDMSANGALQLSETESYALYAKLTSPQQSILDDPVTSQVCRHSYSAKSIADHIKISERTNHSGRAECPVAGCLKYVKLSDLKANKSLARLAARKRAQAGDTDEDSDEYTMME